MSGIVDSFVPIYLHKDFSKKLVSANVQLFSKPKSEITFPEKIECRISYHNPYLYLSYRGISISGLVLPQYVAKHMKHMKPMKIIDKSNLLICPMPGKLIKVLVKEGDVVEDGQALCVVEAMKMENTLIAPKNCKIGKIKFKENDTLSVDQVIMEFAFN